eukprot:GHVT01025658.1.p1 GENE.GHVT01025658.1~~GHVT01025658.1.p1  ORF type:complete len:292 (+),score=14.04 GHVT01025658.1:935-1810(+)
MSPPTLEGLPPHLQLVFRHHEAVTSPTLGPIVGNASPHHLYTVAPASGTIYRYCLDEVRWKPESNPSRVVLDPLLQEQQVDPWAAEVEKVVNGIIFDASGSAVMADIGRRAILRHVVDNEGSRPTARTATIVEDFENLPFFGPHSVAKGNYPGADIFFTDCGPPGETHIFRPMGSVFKICARQQTLSPLCLRGLANPTGLVVANSGTLRNGQLNSLAPWAWVGTEVYVAETGMNRILRFVEDSPGVFQCNVFRQLSGGVGPTALAVTSTGLLIVAHFERSHLQVSIHKCAI